MFEIAILEDVQTGLESIMFPKGVTKKRTHTMDTLGVERGKLIPRRMQKSIPFILL